LAYHERTKHDYGRFARSLGFLDWDSQPDPFRRYLGATWTPLEFSKLEPTPTYEQLFYPGEVAPRRLDASSLSEWLYHSLALSAWKRHESSRWALRVNPSSGNLHPTEAYLLLAGVDGLSAGPGLHHYAPKEHGLELRSELDDATWSGLVDGLPQGSFLVALTSIPWRESWKYGERAWRYCQHDVGHALAALRFAAALLGWRLQTLPDVPDERLTRLLGLDRGDDFIPGEQEHPDLLAIVTTTSTTAGEHLGFVPSDAAVAAVQAGSWFGRANVLSSGHQDWAIIEEVERATAGTTGSPLLATPHALPTSVPAIDRSDDVPLAGRVLRQRRSAVEMDARTGLTRAGFYSMLARLVPDCCAVPWDALSWPALVHLGLFVHRVGDLAPGRYALARTLTGVDALRAAMKPGFAWEKPEGCPEALPLFLLEEGDVRALASGVSCGQDIAADGAFSLGMLAEFEQPLSRHGASLYQRLFWETGMIGQTLYLEAEAAGISSTGIGCFFDDPVHQAFGLKQRTFQSLYHFTVGGAVEDTRISTEPAYADR
jgi:SagB-type dehydrogenase family enzyme